MKVPIVWPSTAKLSQTHDKPLNSASPYAVAVSIEDRTGLGFVQLLEKEEDPWNPEPKLFSPKDMSRSLRAPLKQVKTGGVRGTYQTEAGV